MNLILGEIKEELIIELYESNIEELKESYVIIKVL